MASPEDSHNAGEQVDVLLALAATASSPAHKCPPPGDIAAWHDRTLSTPDRASVEAHLAHCNRCFRLLTGLVETQNTQTAEARSSRKKVSRWRPALVRPAIALGALLVGMFITLQLMSPQRDGDALTTLVDATLERLSTRVGQSASEWPWRTALSTRSADVDADARVSTVHRAFRTGVRAALIEVFGGQGDWQQVIADLPSELPSCGGRATCEQSAATAVNTGRWAVAVFLACNRPDAELHLSWDEQHTALQVLAEQFAQFAPGDPFDRLFAQWAGNDPATGREKRSLICNRIGTLLTLGLVE